jgi:hypothetical protein
MRRTNKRIKIGKNKQARKQNRKMDQTIKRKEKRR